MTNVKTLTTVEELNKIDSLAAEAWDKPWWQTVVKFINDRRLKFLDELVSGANDQRYEDKLRGQINELNFMLALNDYMKQQSETPGHENINEQKLEEF